MTKAEVTNPTDFLGAARMMFGDAVEKAIKDQWLSRLSLRGLHLVDSQVSVGSKVGNVEWHGYVDFIVGMQEGAGLITYPVEFKTKWGWGADFLLKDKTPDDGYIYQIGLYIDDLQRKRTKKYTGKLIYFLISDKNIGTMVEFDVLVEDGVVIVTHYKDTNGYEENLNIRRDLRSVFSKWESVLQSVQNKLMPEPIYRYKHPINEQILEKQSDAQLLSCIEGTKIIGDWQVEYSRYKNLLISLEGTTLYYTPEELMMLEREYLKRHPKSRKFK
jgi:hypothetical protein